MSNRFDDCSKKYWQICTKKVEFVLTNRPFANKNRKNDLQNDLQSLQFSNQGVDLQVPAQISTFANLFSNRSQANTWNIKYALLVASRFLSALSLAVISLSVSFSLPSHILLLIVASRWWLSHCCLSLSLSLSLATGNSKG